MSYSLSSDITPLNFPLYNPITEFGLQIIWCNKNVQYPLSKAHTLHDMESDFMQGLIGMQDLNV